MSDDTEGLIRWLATLAGALVAAAIIGMCGLIWTMHGKVSALEVRVEALQNQHRPNNNGGG